MLYWPPSVASDSLRSLWASSLLLKRESRFKKTNQKSLIKLHTYHTIILDRKTLSFSKRNYQRKDR
jgi:hypothetical protein